MTRIKLPEHLVGREGKLNKKHKRIPSVHEILPFLPNKTLLFDNKALAYHTDISPTITATIYSKQLHLFLKQIKKNK